MIFYLIMVLMKQVEIFRLTITQVMVWGKILFKQRHKMAEEQTMQILQLHLMDLAQECKCICGQTVLVPQIY